MEIGQNEDQENDFEEILEPAPDCCIYRVPQHIRKTNEEAYTPSLISIGPLHYGRKELMGMENQKRRYWEKFAQRVNEEKLHEFKTYIENQEQCIRSHYSVTSRLQSSKYVTMVLCDAVFIIELFLRKYYDTDDFLLKSPVGLYLAADLILLENQLPYFVLNDLYTIAFPTYFDGNQSLFVLLRNYFDGSYGYSFFVERRWQGKHFTDFYRLSILKGLPTVESNKYAIYDLPCATKLNKSGLKFRGVEGKSWLDISLEKRKQYGKWFPWFEVKELRIPKIEIDDGTERVFRNLMAFEMFHYPTKTDMCHYAVLMDQLIDTAKDVDLLVEKGIIVNFVGDNEAIVKMFNSLGSHIIPSGNYRYNDIVEIIRAYYKYPWNHAKATLKSVYFSNLWTGTATVGATLLLILTLIQTVCSIMQVIQGNMDNGNST